MPTYAAAFGTHFSWAHYTCCLEGTLCPPAHSCLRLKAQAELIPRVPKGQTLQTPSTEDLALDPGGQWIGTSCPHSGPGSPTVRCSEEVLSGVSRLRHSGSAGALRPRPPRLTCPVLAGPGLRVARPSEVVPWALLCPWAPARGAGGGAGCVPGRRKPGREAGGAGARGLGAAPSVSRRAPLRTSLRPWRPASPTRKAAPEAPGPRTWGPGSEEAAWSPRSPRPGSGERGEVGDLLGAAALCLRAPVAAGRGARGAGRPRVGAVFALD